MFLKKYKRFLNSDRHGLDQHIKNLNDKQSEHFHRPLGETQNIQNSGILKNQLD